MAKYAVLRTFYASQKWRTLRLAIILERTNEKGELRCEKCGEIITDTIKAIAHHKVELTPENVNDYSISLNPDLIEIVCPDCHNKEHNRFGHSNEREVYIVFGAPLSGKHTYVKQEARRGDIFVDMDYLYQAVSMLPSFDKPDNLYVNVKGIYNLLIDNIKTRYGRWNNAWIVGGFADKYRREKLAVDLGAELIFCEASEQECLARLELDEDRKYRKNEWKQYIEKWFTRFTP